MTQAKHRRHDHDGITKFNKNSQTVRQSDKMYRVVELANLSVRGVMQVGRGGCSGPRQPCLLAWMRRGYNGRRLKKRDNHACRRRKRGADKSALASKSLTCMRQGCKGRRKKTKAHAGGGESPSTHTSRGQQERRLLSHRRRTNISSQPFATSAFATPAARHLTSRVASWSTSHTYTWQSVCTAACVRDRFR